MSVGDLREAIRSSVVRGAGSPLGTTDALAEIDDPHREPRESLLVILASEAQALGLLTTLALLARVSGLFRWWLL